MEYKISDIKKYISKGKMELALEALVSLAEDTEDKDIQNDVIMVSKNYSEFKRNKILNIEERKDEGNKIAYAILGIVSNIEDSFPEEIVDVSSKLLRPSFHNFFNLEMGHTKLLIPNKEIEEKAKYLYEYEVMRKVNEIRKKDHSGFKKVNSKFSKWLQAKRQFSIEELLGSRIIKITQTGVSTIIEVKQNFSFLEYNLHNIKECWEGKWNLEAGIFNMKVNSDAEYDLHVFGHKNGLIHSGVEFANNTYVYVHNLIFIPSREFSNYKKYK